MTNSKFSLIGGREIPIYRYDSTEYSLFYAPGYLAAVKKEQAGLFEEQLFDANSSNKSDEGTKLLHYAQAAQQKLTSLHSSSFSPVCLTLYLNNECNLHCVYCYSNPSAQSGTQLSIETIQAGASLVAKNCRDQDLPLTVVFHGGGEPTLNWNLVDQALEKLEKVASKNEIPLFRYSATNGVMSKEKAELLADRFDLIGISCDGPLSIQEEQRPLIGGGESSSSLERTAEVIRKSGKPLHVRVTITPNTFGRQAEIAEYICQKLGPQEIHVEPVYSSERMGSRIWRGGKEQADSFVDEFVKARKFARRYKVRWMTSGSRLFDIHGPYCNIFRDVLNLVPGGIATACFKTVSMDQIAEKSTRTGSMDIKEEKFNVDHSNVLRLKKILSKSPEKCRVCVNYYHCARLCPDRCPLNEEASNQDWRCRIQVKLSENDLLEMGDILVQKARRKEDFAGSTVEKLESGFYAN